MRVRQRGRVNGTQRRWLVVITGSGMTRRWVGMKRTWGEADRGNKSLASVCLAARPGGEGYYVEANSWASILNNESNAMQSHWCS